MKSRLWRVGAVALGLSGFATVASGAPLDAASLQSAKFSIRLLQDTRSGSKPAYGNSVNAAGEAVGQGTSFPGGGGVWWSTDGALNVLPAYPGTTARFANAINRDGYIVGRIIAGNRPAVLWAPDRTFQALPAPDPMGSKFSSAAEGEGYAINASGKIVGVAAYSGPLFSNWDYATVWERRGDGTYAGSRLDTGLTPAGSPYTGGANDVSDTGLITGSVGGGPGLTHPAAATWNAASALSYLPDPAVPQTILATGGTAVADDGTVAGTVTYYVTGAAGDTGARPAVWHPAAGGGYTPRVLGAPAGTTLPTIFARDMTAGGDLVIGTGWAGVNNSGATTGLLWTDDGTPLALTGLLQDPSWEVADALSVVADGDRLLISALLRRPGPAGAFDTPVPAVLVAVVPEPAGLTTAALLLLPAMLRRHRRIR